MNKNKIVIETKNTTEPEIVEERKRLKKCKRFCSEAGMILFLILAFAAFPLSSAYTIAIFFNEVFNISLVWSFIIGIIASFAIVYLDFWLISLDPDL